MVFKVCDTVRKNGFIEPGGSVADKSIIIPPKH